MANTFVPEADETVIQVLRRHWIALLPIVILSILLALVVFLGATLMAYCVGHAFAYGSTGGASTI